MSQFIVNIFWISIIGSGLTLCIWAFSHLLNRYFAARWKYWVWLLIAVRLIIPFVFSFHQFSVPVISEVIAIQDRSVAEVIIPSAFHVSPGEMPVGMAIERLTVSHVIFSVWIVGCIVFAVIQIARYFAIKRKILRWSVMPKGQETSELLISLSAEMGIKTAIYPMINAEVTSPMIIGLIKPVLMLPHEEYEHSDLELILRHELTHHKNRDIIYKVILFAANTMHWFNPVIYLLVQEAHADMERVCDDDVLKNKTMEERREYSDVILSSISQSRMSGNIFTTHFYTGIGKIKMRFANIMDMKKKKNGVIYFLTVVFAVVLLSGTAPVMGYVRNNVITVSPADTDPLMSHTFTVMTFDAGEIDNLEINLMYGDLMVHTNYEIAQGSKVFVSGTTQMNTLTINPATRTAYIYNTALPLSGFGYYEELFLFLAVSGEEDWAFERASIHLENGNILFAHTHFDEYLAEKINISLPRGAVINQIAYETGVIIPLE